MTSVLEYPTWKFVVALPPNRDTPLNLVLVSIRPISVCRALNSWFREACDWAFCVPLAYCTERSFMRCSMEWTSVRAPSAVWATEMPSWALRAPTLRPPTCERRPSEMARPDASSAARLMRKPEDSFSSDFDIWPCVTDRLRYELAASMFWLIRRLMMDSFRGF